MTANKDWWRRTLPVYPTPVILAFWRNLSRDFVTDPGLDRDALIAACLALLEAGARIPGG